LINAVAAMGKGAPSAAGGVETAQLRFGGANAGKRA